MWNSAARFRQECGRWWGRVSERAGGEMRQMYAVRLIREKRQRRVARRRNFRGWIESMSQRRRDVFGAGPREGRPIEWGIPWCKEEALRCMTEWVVI